MDLNHRPIDFQSIASTAELPGHVVEQRVTPKGDSEGTRVGWTRIPYQDLEYRNCVRNSKNSRSWE